MASISLIISMFLFLGWSLASLVNCEARAPRDFAFVRTRGSHFVLHGSPFLFNGFNAYWMMHVASDPNEHYKVSERVVTRLNTITRVAYRDDSTIMAWELMNEPRCQADYSGRTVNETLGRNRDGRVLWRHNATKKAS
ncbi:hypothetical protein ACS0TY_028512 [Phlomoides rotata]